MQFSHLRCLSFLLLALGFMPSLLGAPIYHPLTEGSSGTSYRGVPFAFGPGAFVTRGQDKNASIATFSDEHVNAVHILAAMGWADWVPQNTTVGQIRAYYAEGDFVTLDLVAGVNISEWAVDRPGWNFSHAKAVVGYSFTANTPRTYDGHYYYSSFAIDSSRHVNRLELRMADAVWNSSRALQIAVLASTAEVIAVPEPGAGSLLMIGAMVATAVHWVTGKRDRSMPRKLAEWQGYKTDRG